MAARVNTRFVILLAGVLILATGAVTGTLYLLSNSGADLVRMGDKKFAAGEYIDAAGFYSKAVNKEKTNPLFLKKWIEALRKQTPETQVKYMATYGELMAAMRQLAITTSDVEGQLEYLEVRRQGMEQFPYDRD